ncbi:MAG: amidohydrolase family protein [Candidatus Aminicenantes bacterium]|nr:amidohydrolase family protein [Candidatus Aminicenantes bacterium]
MKIKKACFLIIFLLVFFIVTLASTGPTYAIVNCRIISPPLPIIEKGIIIIRDGLIEAVGVQGKIQIPDDAEVIEAEGLTAYPGLINAHTNLFLEAVPEPTQQPAASQAQAQPERRPVGPNLLVIDQLKPRKTDLDSFHKIGVTTVLVAPQRGIFAGQSVLLNLNGEKIEEMVIKNPVALHVQFITERGGYPNSLMGTMAYLRQSFLDTAHYVEHLIMWKKTPRFLSRPIYNAFFETLGPFVVEKKPIIFTCNNQEDLKRAIRLTQEFKLQAILSGANEAWRVSEELKAARLPLFVSLNFRPPSTSLYANQGEAARRRAEQEIYPANPAELHKSGLTFALTSLGINDASTFQKNIQLAIKAGLPPEIALKALTVYPAQILGLDSFLGTIEAGKIANIVLCRGELFDPKGQVEKVWVDGRLFKIEKTPEAKAPTAFSVAGSWKVTVTSPLGEMEMTMELEQEGSLVRGTLISSYGRWEIRDGLLSGQELSFNISLTMMGQQIEASFQGRVDKEIIEGTIQIPGGTANFQATRIPRAD